MAGLIDVILQIPVSTILILCISMVLGLTSSIIQRKMVDVEQVQAFKEKLDEVKRQLNEAKKRGDRKAVVKLQRKQMVIMRESSAVMSQQFRASFIVMIPFLALYWGLITIFGTTVVAMPSVWLCV